MIKLLRVKGIDYDSSSRKKEIDKLIERQFADLDELADCLPGGCYIPISQEIRINNLPYTIKDWPIYERCLNSTNSSSTHARIIAKIKVVE